MTYNSYKLFANIESGAVSKELASALNMPPKDKRQPDLQYITAVFVSTGFNLNSAYFLPSEVFAAKGTIDEKPLDLEHTQDKIVGHLFSNAFTYKSGEVFNPVAVAKKSGDKVDNLSFNVVSAMRLYKARFPELAQEVSSGKYKVSMECYYEDFDIIVDDIIIPRDEAASLGLVDVVNNIVKVKEGAESRGEHRVGRVLRNMLFSGCGLVEQPANPESLILEAASRNESYILDLTKVDSYMNAKKEQESIVVHSLSGKEMDLAYIMASYGGIHQHEVPVDQAETFNDGEHRHLVFSDNVPLGYSIMFVEDGAHSHGFNTSSGKLAKESEHEHKVLVETEEGAYKAIKSSSSVKPHEHELQAVEYTKDDLTGETIKSSNFGVSESSGTHYHMVTLPDGTELKTITPQDILKMKDEKSELDTEEAGTGNVDGLPISRPEICVSFKRYVYKKGGDNPGSPETEYNTPGMVEQEDVPHAPGVGGAGETISQNDEIIHENWCALFDMECPVPGGLATHPDCWRMVFNRTTKDAVTNYFEKIQENREKYNVNKAMSSLLELIERAKEF